MSRSVLHQVLTSVVDTLMHRCALNNLLLVLPVQGSPLGREFGEFVSAAKITMLGVVPSIVKAWRHSDCMQVMPRPTGQDVTLNTG